jgi:hypothetical protein
MKGRSTKVLYLPSVYPDEDIESPKKLDPEISVDKSTHKKAMVGAKLA